MATDLFTQHVFTQDGISYLDTQTAPLAAEVRYLVNGTAFVPTAQYDCDLDGDGDTDAGDAQIILNYVAGLLDEVDRKADLDGDGQITTYDAYCLLNALETGRMVLPAGSSVEVTAEILLTEDTKASLDRQYENGAYLEGYLFVEPVATSGGKLRRYTPFPFWASTATGPNLLCMTGSPIRMPCMATPQCHTLASFRPITYL